MFNFLGTQYEVKEGDGSLKIGIIRQGGTEGKASVRFKAIDITSSYGDDYTIYTNKKKNSAMKKGKGAFPLIKTAMTDAVNISVEEAEDEDDTDIVDSAANDFAEKKAKKDSGKKAKKKTDETTAEDYKDADKVDAVGSTSDDLSLIHI